MPEQLLPQRKQLIQAPVEPIVIDVGSADAEKIIEGGVGVPVLAERQLGTWCTEPPQTQNARYCCPVDLLATAVDMLFEKAVQAQTTPQSQGHVDLAKLPHAFNADAGKIDFRPLGWI